MNTKPSTKQQALRPFSFHTQFCEQPRILYWSSLCPVSAPLAIMHEQTFTWLLLHPFPKSTVLTQHSTVEIFVIKLTRLMDYCLQLVCSGYVSCRLWNISVRSISTICFNIYSVMFVKITFLSTSPPHLVLLRESCCISSLDRGGGVADFSRSWCNLPHPAVRKNHRSQRTRVLGSRRRNTRTLMHSSAGAIWLVLDPFVCLVRGL